MDERRLLELENFVDSIWKRSRAEGFGGHQVTDLVYRQSDKQARI